LANNDHPFGLDPCAAELIRRKAQHLVRRPGFSIQDYDDVAQDLTLLLLRRWPSFDPERGSPHAFITTVLRNAAANLLRDRVTRLRRQGRLCSLQDRVPGPDGRKIDRAETLGQEVAGARRRNYPRPSAEVARLGSRVMELLDQLPPDLRELAELLKEHPLAEVARILAVPRTTLYARTRRLREWFGHRGLPDFF
jgi:RNA polymerase sigma factor (sigma-70 family)